MLCNEREIQSLINLLSMNPNLQIILVAIFIFILSFSLAPLSLPAQQSYFIVKGKVIDKITKIPLQGASVFAQNTTIGEASDESGNFSIRLPQGGYSLVATFTGYETEELRVNNSTTETDSIVIELSPQEKSLEEVTIAITNEVKDGWEKYGSFFIENFIGQTQFSNLCVIKNPQALHFYFSQKRNRLKITATEPIVVDNFALGYTLRFAIDSFTNDYNTHTNLFIGYPLFEEMKGTAENYEAWAANRAKAYRGSMLQFMRSLYSRALQQDGFEVQFIERHDDSDVYIQPENIYRALNYRKDDTTGIVQFYPDQKEIAVIYNGAAPETTYLILDPAASKKFQSSSLIFSKNEWFFIEQNGYFYNQEDVISNGYMGFKKIGDMLPYDYDPE